MFLLIGTVLFAIACLVTVLFSRFATAERRRAENAATSMLEETGLVPQGDVLGTFSLRGLVHGVEIDLINRKDRLPPGNLEGHVSTCVVQVAVPIADQIVFEIAKIDQVMGLLPTAPRVRTGYASFDDVYAVFVVSTGDATGGSYRRNVDANAVPWGHSLLLDRLIELDLRWIRVQEGRAEIVFPPLPLSEVRRAAELAAAIACTSQGKPLPVLSGGPRAPWVAWPDARYALYYLWAFGAVVALSIGKYLSPDDSIGARETAWTLIVLSAIVIVGSSVVALRRGWTSS